MKADLLKTNRSCKECGYEFQPEDRIYPTPQFKTGSFQVASITDFICQKCRDAKVTEYDLKAKCHGCGALHLATVPYQWTLQDGEPHRITNMALIYQATRCCGRIAHTEPVAAVCAYLHNWKHNGKMVCELINKNSEVEAQANDADMVRRGVKVA